MAEEKDRRKRWFLARRVEKSPLAGLTPIPEARIPKEYLADLLDIEPTLTPNLWRLATNVYSEFILEPRKGGDAELRMVQDFLDSAKTFTSSLIQAVFDAFWSGSGWLYLQANKTGDAYIDVIRIDPLKIDFKRDDRGRALLDDKGNPVALVLTVTNPEDGTEEEKEVSPDDYSHIKFISTRMEPWGRSLLEGAYNAIVIKANIELNLGKSVDVATKRPIIIKVGSPQTPRWTPGNMKQLYEDFKDPYTLEKILVPFDVSIEPLETSPILDVTNALKYFENLLAGALFLPKIETGGRRAGAIESIDTTWEGTLASMRKILAEQVESQIFTKVVKKAGGDPDLVPRVVFRSKSPAALLARARRLGVLARAGLLKYSRNLENALRAEEGLPPLEEGEVVEEPKAKEEEAEETEA